MGKFKRFFILNYLSVLNRFQYTSNTKQNYLDFGGTKTKIISWKHADYTVLLYWCMHILYSNKIGEIFFHKRVKRANWRGKELLMRIRKLHKLQWVGLVCVHYNQLLCSHHLTAVVCLMKWFSDIYQMVHIINFKFIPYLLLRGAGFLTMW